MSDAFVSLDGELYFVISWITIRHIKTTKFIQSFGKTTKAIIHNRKIKTF